MKPNQGSIAVVPNMKARKDLMEKQSSLPGARTESEKKLFEI